MKQTTRLACLALVAILIGPASALAQRGAIQFQTPVDQDGINQFEPSKDDSVPFDGLQVRIGAAFAQQFQALSHENDAPVDLIGIGAGTNLAAANLNLDAQLADGIRVNLITYLSSRHHPEAWVKGGFFQIDKLPMFNSDVLDDLMQYLTIRVGHFEVNYGDAHFRRTDNGNAMHNPFVGNYIMDAFTTEVGGEVVVQNNGFLALVGVTGGEIQGGINTPAVGKRLPSYLGKVGFDRQFSDDLRGRLTGSVYTTTGSARNTLYGGDRAGSRYYLVMEPVGATTAANFTSGRINPNMVDRITAIQVNPFLKYRGLEVFGVIETASGRAHAETENRVVTQYAADLLYRFGPREQLYVGGRYNVVDGELAPNINASVDRFQIGGGWFVTRNVLAKIEYVQQNYNDFPSADIRHGGTFRGLMFEGVVAF